MTTPLCEDGVWMQARSPSAVDSTCTPVPTSLPVSNSASFQGFIANRLSTLAGGPLALVQQRDGYDVQLSYSDDPSKSHRTIFKSR